MTVADLGIFTECVGGLCSSALKLKATHSCNKDIFYYYTKQCNFFPKLHSYWVHTVSKIALLPTLAMAIRIRSGVRTLANQRRGVSRPTCNSRLPFLHVGRTVDDECTFNRGIQPWLRVCLSRAKASLVIALAHGHDSRSVCSRGAQSGLQDCTGSHSIVLGKNSFHCLLQPSALLETLPVQAVGLTCTLYIIL